MDSAYLTGHTKSTDFPVLDAIQATKGAESCAAPPCEDAFLTKLDALGSALVYSTYLGGGGDDQANGIALDGNGGVYLAGEGNSSDFPVTPGAYDTTLNGTKDDVFIVKISEPVEPPPPSGMSPNYNWHYEYDNLSRLTSACSDWDAGTSTCLGDGFNYSYDGAGNLLAFSRWDEAGAQVETVKFVYNHANQIACLDGGGNGACGDPDDVAYIYDAYGNLTSDGSKTFAYDAENRLISVTDGISTTNYSYNGDGDRISQTVDGVTTSYVIDIATPLTMVLAETTGTETIYYLHGLDLVAQNDGISTEYFGYDGLGSVRQMFSGSGSVLFAQVFDPYGNPYASAGMDSTGWGFTGEQTDTYIKLIYLRARWYSPETGRFTSRDIWQGDYTKPLSLNPWLYVYNNPVNLTDPSGMAPECDRFERADLTQWLVDEMNENRKSHIFLVLWTAVHLPEYIDTLVPGPPEFKLPPELASYGIALGLFADVVKPHGLWDFKNEINRLIGDNIRITKHWYRFDVPGNVYFGFIGLAAGFNEVILHCGADYATNGIPCSGSDSIEDYEAIEAGFDIYEQSEYGLVDENTVRTALMKHPLIAAGKKTEPNDKSLLLPWPYPVGTFDDGSSGWIIKHR